MFTKWNERRRELKRSRMFESGKEELFHFVQKRFFILQDAKVAMFQVLASLCSIEECENLSRQFGRLAHEKARSQDRRARANTDYVE